jgi:FkbM family methyltransferase
MSTLDNNKETIRNILRVKKIVKNWYSIPLYHLHLTKRLVLKLRNGVKLLYVPKAFSVEHFLEEPYRMLSVSGRIVVDVGAYSGDSAIFFVRKGAKHVLAFEPFPFPYKVAKANIALNNINNITLFQEAIGSEDNYIFINPETKGPSANINENGQTKVRINSLSTIINKMCLSNAVLKMDCEGSEICLLGIDKKILNVFSEIILEYHQEGYKELQNKLNSCGYETILLDMKGTITNSPPVTNGLIYAKLLLF